MNVAVLSLCRDRIEYSQHCFARLHELAGCEFDHLILDQGSSDGTWEWLTEEYEFQGMAHREPSNIGISKGLNLLLGVIDEGADYDVIVKFDNDCEIVTPDTLKVVCEAVMESQWILGPVMHGYGSKLHYFRQKTVGEYTFNEVDQVYGNFLAAPAALYAEFRYSESNPLWGGDDPEVCHYWRGKGNHVGQVLGYEANHYETTEGQEARYREYFANKVAEGMPWG